MPELPEVETVRRTLGTAVIGRRVETVVVHRADVVSGPRSAEALGAGGVVTAIERKGKQLALVTGRACICIHLGMSGSLRLLTGEQKPPIHTHITWLLAEGQRFVFADPRRFGGVWTFADMPDLHAKRWSKLGPDATAITPIQLHQALVKTRRAVKNALLDQHVTAGLGNIYVDELLFRCRIHPVKPACELTLSDVRRLVGIMQRLLSRAIDAGGTTLRDYVDGAGRKGGFQTHRKVHGRSGLPCIRCGGTLEQSVIGGRTTVACPTCQGVGGSKQL